MTTISNLPVTKIASGAVAACKAIGYDGAVVGAKAVIEGVARTPAADGEAFQLDADGYVTVLSASAWSPGDQLETDANGDFTALTDGQAVARGVEAATAAGEKRLVRLIPH